MTIARLFLLVALFPTVVLADYDADKKQYDECVAKVKKDHALPPASINALKQIDTFFVRRSSETAGTG